LSDHGQMRYPSTHFATSGRSICSRIRCHTRNWLRIALGSALWSGLLLTSAAQTPPPPAKPEAPALPLPETIAPEGLDSPNPLLLFDPTRRPPPGQMNQPDDSDLQPLSPFMPGETPPPAPPPTDLTPAQRELIALAQKVAGSVVSVRVWDEFGGLLAAGVGAFVSADGMILTDSSLLHPEIAADIDYITTTAANGTNHRVTGFYTADLRSGVALLQSDGPAPIPLQLKTDHDFSKPSACRVVALSDKRGLLIADAKVSWEDTLAGQGWLSLRGEDSPGGVGSPVLDATGSIIGLVAMKTPLTSWMNFALPAEMAAFEMQRKRPPLKALSALPRVPKRADVAKDPEFLTAYTQIQSRSMSAATRTLLRLTKKYPRSAECWALLGISAGYMGATPDALSCQRKAVALDPQSGLYWHQMAMAQIRSRSVGDTANPVESEEYEALIKATEANANDRISWLLLASHHIKAGRLSEAEAALKRLIFLAPTYAQGFYLLAFVKSKTNDYPAAKAAIQRCLEINDQQSAAWYLLGLIHEKLGENKDAADAFRKTTRINPDHPQAWLNLARTLKTMGRLTEATQAYREHRERLSRANATANDR
jgi:tetratricopeptide (TPR) repeat protein